MSESHSEIGTRVPFCIASRAGVVIAMPEAGETAAEKKEHADMMAEMQARPSTRISGCYGKLHRCMACRGACEGLGVGGLPVCIAHTAAQTVCMTNSATQSHDSKGNLAQHRSLRRACHHVEATENSNIS